ncbi:MAG: acyltransferase family protein [Victivallaceae bacterium]
MMKSASPDNRVAWIDGSRAAAMLFIVGFHVLFLLTSRMPASRYLLGTVTDSGTVIFTLLAGVLMRHNLDRFSYPVFIRKKLSFVFAPYVIASLALLVLHAMKHGGGLTVGEVLTALLWGTASVPFWFIPMIMVFFILSPAWVWIDRRGLYYLCAPLAVVPFVVGRGHHFELWRNILFFFPFFLAGMALSRYWPRVHGWLAAHRWRLLILLPAIPVAASFAHDCEPLQTASKTAATLFVVTMFGCFDIARGRALGLTAAASMSIYLYHNSVIGIFAPLVSKLPALPEPVVLLLWAAATLAITAVLTVAFETAHRVLTRLGMKNTRWLLGR